jgi:hypothetical protein
VHHDPDGPAGQEPDAGADPGPGRPHPDRDARLLGRERLWQTTRLADARKDGAPGAEVLRGPRSVSGGRAGGCYSTSPVRSMDSTKKRWVNM